MKSKETPMSELSHKICMWGVVAYRVPHSSFFNSEIYNKRRERDSAVS